MSENQTHTILPFVQTVDSKLRVLLVDLSAAYLCKRFNRRQAAVFSEGQRNSLEGGGEGAHGILFD